MSHDKANPVSAYLASIASKGGKATGARKRRSPAHYAALADAAREKARLRKESAAK